MCTTIKEPMKIRVSESTYKLIKKIEFLSFTEELVEAKGKGEMKTFLVEFKEI